MHVTLYSDGSSRGNPGPGGYGSVLLYTDPAGKLHTLEKSQGYRRTTNNRMELMGVIIGLEALKRPCTVEVWKRLLVAKEPHEVTFHWVRGHAGHEYNERCDTLATQAADSGALIEDEGFEG